MAEKGVNDIPRDVRPLFTKGNDALARENFDYAIDLFNQVLAREPRIYDCRKALRAAQFGKAGSGRGFFKKAWSSASSSPQVAKAQMALRKDPVEALAIQLANALADIGDVQRAERTLSDLLRTMPTDGDLAQALKNISARRTMKEGGYGALASGEGSYRDILKDEKEAVSLEQEKRVQKTEDVAERLIAEYESRLQTEPDNLKLVRSLAELYTQKNQFDRAVSFYERIKSTEMGNDPSLERAMAETHVRRFDHE